MEGFPFGVVRVFFNSHVLIFILRNNLPSLYRYVYLSISLYINILSCVRFSKENLICSNIAPAIHIFNIWRHQKLLLLPNQLQDSTFLFEINSKDIDTSKLVSQSKLLPSLFELKDKDTIVMSTIIKKISHKAEAY